MIYLYKIKDNLLTDIKKISKNYYSINNLTEAYETNKSFILIVNIDKLDDAEYKTLQKIAKKNSYIIALIKTSTSSKDKLQAYNSGTKSFLYENADIIELKLIIDNLSPTLKDKKSYTLFPGGLINNLPTPIFIKNKKGVFTDCNEAFCTFLAKNKDEIIGQTINEFVTNKKARIYEEIDKLVIEKGEEKQHITRMLMADGQISNAIVNKSPLYNANGSIQSLIGIITDISELKRREKELIKLKQKAQEADRLKTAFLSNMSHEIRTPMNAIVGFSQLLALPDIPNKKKHIYIDQINHNANQLLKLIEDIIEVSKIEAKKVSKKLNKCYVNMLLDELKISFETHKARLGKTEIKLIVEKANLDKYYNVITDQYRLNQILTNLLGNAIKFTDKGFIKFGYKFITEDNSNFLEFFVEDTGFGINKDKIKYVFDRFSKVPADKTKLYGGTGLGLSISKSLTELLGGHISLESKENYGTTFKFTIPKVEDKIKNASDELKIITQEKIRSKNFNWKDKTVLVAEDEEMNYLFIQEVLRDSNVNIIWSHNGKEATQKFKENKNIDLVLMDIKMPYMDGYEATKIIKQINPNTPIIALTAYAMEKERNKGYEAGCNEYIQKPIKQEILLQLLDKYFSLK